MGGQGKWWCIASFSPITSAFMLRWCQKGPCSICPCSPPSSSAPSSYLYSDMIGLADQLFPLQLLQRGAENRQARLYPDGGRHLARKTEKPRYNRDIFQYGSTFVSTLHSPLSLSSVPYLGSPPCSGYSVLTPWFISTEYTCLMSAANGWNGRSGYTVLRA